MQGEENQSEHPSPVPTRFPTEESCLDTYAARYGDARMRRCGSSAHFSGEARVPMRGSIAARSLSDCGTPFDRPALVARWLVLRMFMFCSTRNGVAAKEVERQIGVTYKTACACARNRYMAADGDDPLGGSGGVSRSTRHSSWQA